MKKLLTELEMGLISSSPTTIDDSNAAVSLYIWLECKLRDRLSQDRITSKKKLISIHPCQSQARLLAATYCARLVCKMLFVREGAIQCRMTMPSYGTCVIQRCTAKMNRKRSLNLKGHFLSVSAAVVANKQRARKNDCHAQHVIVNRSRRLTIHTTGNARACVKFQTSVNFRSRMRIRQKI